MNTMFRWIVSLALGGALTLGILIDSGRFSGNKKSTNYRLAFSPYILAMFLILFLVICLGDGSGDVPELYFSLMFSIFFQIFMFYCVLLLILPLLRRYISAKTIATIWILPNLLYLASNFMARSEPEWVIRIDRISLAAMEKVWLIMAAAVFAWYLIRHLLYRYQLLHNAKPLEDPKVTDLWKACQQEFDLKKAGYRAVVSDRTRTPLSVGLFKFTTVLVLPDRTYSEEEYKLIFKHELIHILRGDSQVKLFVALCNALCWFNPLMWFAMKKCTEDLEFSCDELVLESAGKQEKELYANLILSTAGNQAGFTTCLSADAAALKYRLTNICRPKRKWNGAVIAGMLLAVMLFTNGLTAFSYNNQKVEDLFAENEKEAVLDRSVTYAEGETWYACVGKDTDAVDRYLKNLEICNLTGNYEMDSDARGLFCRYETDKGLVVLEIRGNLIKYVPFYDIRRETHTYYLEEPINWEYILSLMEQEQETAE